MKTIGHEQTFDGVQVDYLGILNHLATRHAMNSSNSHQD
jgi:hypothetical protein